MNYEETLKNIEKFIEKRPDASAYQDYFVLSGPFTERIGIAP